MTLYKNFNINNLEQILDFGFQVRGSVRSLAGYQDKNYMVTAGTGEKFILKITVNPKDLDFIRSQNRILRTLSDKPVGKLVPCPLSGLNREYYIEISDAGNPAYARLFPYLGGEFLAKSKPELPFYHDLGRVFGEIDQEMDGLEDAILKCRTHDWDLARVMEVADDLSLIDDVSDRRLVHYFLMKYREVVLPVYHRLPKGLIHTDGNDWNILVADSRERVAGVIDFGDMIWCARVNEVAIILAYAIMGRADFREVYQEIVTGYQEVTVLSEIELSVLHYLVAARWCQTMVMAARQERINPGSAYHQVSVQGARSMLHKWIRENPERDAAIVHGEVADQVVPGGGDKLPVKDECVERRYRYFSRAVSLSYPEPIKMTGAAMQYMYGSDGRTYLDCVNNIPHVGHCHPAVVEAGQRQMARLNTNTRYLYDGLDRYAGRLLSKFPSSLNKIFFVNSGSAATDLAVRLAEAHTGRCDYLVLEYAYHGNTQAAIGLSPYKFNRRGGKGKPDQVTILPTDPGGAQVPPVRKAQTFFAESIVGCAGQIVLSKEFMQQTVNRVRESGGIYVADEVQTGFGRVGSNFWAYELYDVVPDMVILGKPMGNGHPMGAVVCTEEIARSFETGMEFFSSFGGNPVSCEIGLAVLQVVEEEGLQENARLVGDFLLAEISRQAGEVSGKRTGGNRHLPDVPFNIREVRGSGLFLGIELVESRTGKPATETAVRIVNLMKEGGFLLSTDGPFNNVIKFKPPMCFSMKNAEELLNALKTIIGY